MRINRSNGASLKRSNRLCAFILVLALAIALPQLISRIFPPPSCKCLSSDPSCWPNLQILSDFNASVNGRLIEVLPPAAPCHDPNFDEEACRVAREKWNFPFWRSDQPGSMEQNNWEASNDGHGCFIASNRSSTCFQGEIPTYAVSVLQPAQVQTSVKFASKHNLRLVIRNTGHDYLGRSTAAGALSIWMHHLKSISIDDSFVPEECDVSGVPAVSVGAGVQFEELYQAAFEREKLVVGGFCSSVGAAGGYPQTAGHGLLAPFFGLGSDNILQYQVVMADGELVTANSCQNRDLFWALRGGGGGTFGIVVSATYKTHPAFRSLVSALYQFTTANTSAMETLVDRFAELNPSLSDAGWSGAFVLSHDTPTVAYLLPDRDYSVATQTISPLVEHAQVKLGIHFYGALLNFSSFHQWHLQVQCQAKASCIQVAGSNALAKLAEAPPIGIPIALSSRLIPRRTLESSHLQLAKALVKLAKTPKFGPMFGGLVAGGRVADPQDNAVNPAWRRALWLMLLPSSWEDGAPKAERDLAAKIVSDARELLTELTPGSAAYSNEADYNEPNWQQSLFGEHYPRLLAIKKKVDPKSLFVCHHCVGSEDWSSDLNCKL